MKEDNRINVEEMIKANRLSLKPDWQFLKLHTKTDKRLEKETPEVYKKQSSDDVVVLDKDFDDPLINLILKRQSIRRFSSKALTVHEVSYLLYSIGKLHSEGNGWTKRVIPTAGATHNLETYVIINNVESLKQGLYRYMPDSGNLEYLKAIDLLEFNDAIYKQLRNTGIVVLWSSIPYRTEYKYSFTAHKMISMEAGHACQNLYLASEQLHLGCCAIGAYDQSALDKVIGFDGENEFGIYLATVGHI